MLNKYLNDSKAEVFKASDARQIRKFFKFVTMSVSVRNRSINPDTFTPIKASDIDNIEITNNNLLAIKEAIHRPMFLMSN
jgi:uncharacterized protein YegL